MELDVSVLDELLEVEGRVDDLQLDDPPVVLLVVEGLGDVDDDSPTELLVSVGVFVGDVGLGVSGRRSLTMVTSLSVWTLVMALAGI